MRGVKVINRMGVSPPFVPCAATGRPNGPPAASPTTPATLAATSARASLRPTPALSMPVVLRAAVERPGSPAGPRLPPLPRLPRADASVPVRRQVGLDRAHEARGFHRLQ